jgi:hypothetical protein
MNIIMEERARDAVRVYLRSPSSELHLFGSASEFPAKQPIASCAGHGFLRALIACRVWQGIWSNDTIALLPQATATTNHCNLILSITLFLLALLRTPTARTLLGQHGGMQPLLSMKRQLEHLHAPSSQCQTLVH